MPNPLNLSFGVEFECIVAFDAAEYEPGIYLAEGTLWENHGPSKLRPDTKLRILCREHVARVLDANGFPAYGATERGDNQKWKVSNKSSIDIKSGPRSQDGFLECDVEIKSPGLRFCPRGLRRVQHVVRLLRTEFDMSVNDSCGLRVHIGNQKEGFPLATLKHFSILTAIFEHQLNTLHPANRVGNIDAKGPSAVFKRRNPWDIVQKIQCCDTRAELVLLYAENEDNPDRFFAYNLCPMLFGPYRTIEFRQHKGTLEWPEMVDWVQLAGGVVDAAHQISAVDLAQLISTCAFDPSFTVSDLLYRLGLEALIPYYSDHLDAHRRPGPMWVLDRKGPGMLHAGERWDELERRQRVERFEESERLQKLDKQHELERRRWLETQDETNDEALMNMPI